MISLHNNFAWVIQLSKPFHLYYNIICNIMHTRIFNTELSNVSILIFLHKWGAKKKIKVKVAVLYHYKLDLLLAPWSYYISFTFKIFIFQAFSHIYNSIILYKIKFYLMLWNFTIKFCPFDSIYNIYISHFMDIMKFIVFPITNSKKNL